MPLYKQRQQKMRCKIALIFVKSIYIYMCICFLQNTIWTQPLLNTTQEAYLLNSIYLKKLRYNAILIEPQSSKVQKGY